MGEVLAVNDARIAGPLRELIAAGTATGEFDVADARDTANAVLGAIVMAVVGRAAADESPSDPDFRAALVDQVVRGLERR